MLNQSNYLITLAHHIEEEGVCVIIQGLVIKKQLGQEAQVLRVRFVLSSVNFKERDIILPVNLISWWVSEITF